MTTKPNGGHAIKALREAAERIRKDAASTRVRARDLIRIADEQDEVASQLETQADRLTKVTWEKK